MKNKAHFVNRLCQLKQINPQSEGAQELYKLSVVDLLIEIKKATPTKVEPEELEDEDMSLAQRIGCT